MGRRSGACNRRRAAHIPSNCEDASIGTERLLGLWLHELRWAGSAPSVDGPSTSSKLAARLGYSSGLTAITSGHSPNLGLVEEQEDHGTRKERWWKALPYKLDVAGPGTEIISAEDKTAVISATVLAEARRFLDFWSGVHHGRNPADEEWSGDTRSTILSTRLTHEQFRQLADEITELVSRWEELSLPADPSPAGASQDNGEAPDPVDGGTRRVHFVIRAYPLPDRPGDHKK